MSQNAIEQTIDLGDGRSITIETGKLATQADGSVVVRMGGTMLLATVVSQKEAREGFDYFPLSVDYREKFAAAGRFPGGFLKREARPSDYEVLASRLTDRALRPLFPDDYQSETQVIIYLLSHDKETMPDALACLAASSAIAVSDIPFNGPVSETRVARINGEWKINPQLSETKDADIDLIVAATEQNIVMVEGEMKEASEAEMIEAIKFAHESIKIQCKAQLELAEKAGVSKEKRKYSHVENDESVYEAIKAACYDKCYEVAKKGMPNKHERYEAFAAIKEEYKSTLSEEDLAEKGKFISRYFHDVEKEAVRRAILDEKIRLDGRKSDEIRPIWSEVDYLPSTHGSAIFTRGETQSLTTVTLGTKLDEQTIDGVFIEGKEKFLLHYNFPPFSTGEAKFLRGTSRREIGHGNLAYRALKPVIPEDCPYTLRVVSDILESNGSSSMATVCAGSLALMDAGIQIKKPVTGIAMGLITDADGKYAVLSDILGDEDHLGDMDFKVTGTRDGITACQMDIKIEGLSYEVLGQALEQAKLGRLHIMDEITKTLAEPRDDYKPHAPRIVQITIPKDFIGAVIGPGGKVIQEIQATTGSTIIIEEEGEFGIVDIAADNKESIDAALTRIKAITTMPEIGEEYMGTVKSVLNFGAFVEILPGKDGLLHISEIDWKRIENVSDVLKEGDQVKVKLTEIDRKTGKLRLSRKVLMPRPERQEKEPQQS
ncbi:MAG: polyribonucleotide nucleotidyltransferase [Flavobacteriales bacterium]|nr:polyribonucleotide nucleotidyltransferase [Bacteroidales bacterium AH-315-I05]PCJ86347.1 MAG: polyribonucleotide nucleotidyltransferase [Flavobacteriales bacterium]